MSTTTNRYEYDVQVEDDQRLFQERPAITIVPRGRNVATTQNDDGTTTVNTEPWEVRDTHRVDLNEDPQ